jgi:hypothetical protein
MLTWVGPQVFLSTDSPTYRIAFATHMGCYTLLVIIIISLRFYLKKENRLKEALATSLGSNDDDQDVTHAFDDLTDRENLGFKYVY